MSRAMKDIKMAIDFLCTLVRITNEDDKGKLVRLLRYIRGTLHLPLILRADRLSFIKWWVDGSFAVHPYYKGHTGLMVYMVFLNPPSAWETDDGRTRSPPTTNGRRTDRYGQAKSYRW